MQSGHTHVPKRELCELKGGYFKYEFVKSGGTCPLWPPVSMSKVYSTLVFKKRFFAI